MNSKCSYFVQPQLRKKGLKYNALLSRDEREPDVSEAKLRLRPRLEKFWKYREAKEKKEMNEQ